jgi:hypothetical protein
MLVKLASALPAKAAEGGEPSIENPTEASREEAPRDEAVTLAPEEDAPETAVESEGEGGEKAEREEDRPDDNDGDRDESGKPQKLSRNQRKNRKLAEQAAKIKELEDRLVRTQGFANDDLSLPRPEEFPGNYPAFARALRAYEVRRAVREENARGAKASEAAAELQRVRVSAYNERLTEVKDRIPDFEETLQEARRTDIRDDVRDLILESAKGPLIAYHLAKNLDKVAELNRMPQLAAAREIGRLEARIRGPQPKRQTSAPPPLTPPRGGTGGVAKKVEHMSMDEFVREREAGRL